MISVDCRFFVNGIGFFIVVWITAVRYASGRGGGEVDWCLSARPIGVRHSLRGNVLHFVLGISGCRIPLRVVGGF